MLLNELLKAIQPVQIAGDSNIEIAGINIDSRLVEAGQLFMAMRGTQADGHAYIPAAISKGATAILCEDMPEKPVEGITYIQVKDSEDAVGKIATTFYGDPTSKLELVGVTGTNGKTTIATLLYNTFRYFGYKVGLISTVCNYIDDEPIPTEHTTPDPITLNRLLGRMADEGCKYAFMEVSSHSIAQKRISGLKFAGGIFTNLTRDHLDYHKTVENYLKAKKKFFDDLPKNAFSLTNLDDKNGLVMTQNTRSKVYTYSLRSLSDFKGRVLESHFEGMLLDFNNHELAVQFIGKFNASNLLAVFGAAVLLGKKEEDVLVVKDIYMQSSLRIKPYPLKSQLITEDYPIWDSGDIPMDIEDELVEMEDSGEITDYYDYTDCFAGHKIGGYPNYIQSGIDFGDGYEFMIQIASDEKANLNIIDSGNFYLAKNSQTGDWRLYCDFY